MIGCVMAAAIVFPLILGWVWFETPADNFEVYQVMVFGIHVRTIAIDGFEAFLMFHGLVWASIPVGCLATAILAVNNVRDRKGDREAGKGTLVARFGRSAGVAEYALLLAAAYLVPLWLFRGSAEPWILLPFVTLPRAALLMSALVREEGRALNAVLVGTAQLMVLYGVLFTAGIVLGL